MRHFKTADRRRDGNVWSGHGVAKRAHVHGGALIRQIGWQMEPFRSDEIRSGDIDRGGDDDDLKSVFG